MRIILRLPYMEQRIVSLSGYEMAVIAGFYMYGITQWSSVPHVAFDACLCGSLLLYWSRSCTKLLRVLLSPLCAFPLSYLLILVCLWKRFTPSLSALIWHDDAPNIYYSTIEGLRILSEGGVVGWRSIMLGGYPSIFNSNSNLALFSWPFMLIWGNQTGFNVFIFSTMMMFPLLCYFCARAWIRSCPSASVWALYFSCAYLIGYMGDFLGNCTFDNMIAIDLYVLALVFARGFLDMKPMSGFYLAIAIALSGYAHPAFFVLCLLTVCALVIAGYRRIAYVGRLAILLAVVFFCTLPYGWFVLNYTRYFVENQDKFAVVAVDTSFHARITMIIHGLRGMLDMPGSLAPGIVLLPICVWLLMQRTDKEMRAAAWAYLLLIAIIGVGMEFTAMTFQRMLRGMPVFWILFLSAQTSPKVSGNGRGRTLASSFLFFIVATSLVMSVPSAISWSTPRLKSLDRYSRPFLEMIEGLGGNLVLFEGQGGLNHATETAMARRSEKWSDDVHLLGPIALATGKNFFSWDADGFHPSIFRSNAIPCGTYKGRFLSEYPPQEINALLKKWGIKYLVLWSNEARDYFGRQGGSYKRIWNIDTGELQKAGFEPVRWEIYEFFDADPRSVVVASGSGEIETKDYFTKILRLRGVKKGEKVIVRMNYFPAWRAFWEGHDVDLFNEDGQLAMQCPADGNMIIRLYFPRYTVLTIMAVLSLAACFFLAKRGYV